MKHQAIICSYRKDFPWLPHCLTSLNRLAHGFLPPVICVDQADSLEAKSIVLKHYPEATVVVKNGRLNQGFMRAQIAMMQADLFCKNADIIHFIGSDCIAKQNFDASIYADDDGKPYVLYTPYDKVGPAKDWQAGVHRVLGIIPDFEFMRRLPSVFPASVFPMMRARVEQVHRMPFEDYIYKGDIGNRNTSEANIVGAYAYYFMPETCHFVSTEEEDLKNYPTGLAQFWSHGGLDRPIQEGFEYIANGKTKTSLNQTPRAVIHEILYSGASIP